MTGQFSTPVQNTQTPANTGNGREKSPGVYFNLDLQVAKDTVISLPYGAELDSYLAKKSSNGNLNKLLEMLLGRLDELPAGEQEITLNCPIKVRVRPNAAARTVAEADATGWEF